jgi:hypothetical protein
VSTITHGMRSIDWLWPDAGMSNTTVSQTGWPRFSSVAWYQALPMTE